MIKWGIIGAGDVVLTKSGKCFNTKNSCIHAVMRRDKKKAEEAKEILHAKVAYTNIKDLLNDKEITAVYIATPPGKHLEQANLCCQKKLPTYLEKPFGRNYQEALEIVRMYQDNHVPLFIAHYKLYLPMYQRIKELLDKEIIGKITEVDFRLDRKYIPNSWLYKPEMSGGGKFYDIAPHSIYIMIYLFGKFKNVYSFCTNHQKDYSVEDTVLFLFQTEKNIIGTANFNLVSHQKKDCMVIHGTKGEIKFSIHGDNKITIITDTIQEEIFEIPELIEKNMIEDVIATFHHEKDYSVNMEDALETYRVIDCILNDYYKGRNDDFWNRSNWKLKFDKNEK